MTRGRAERRRPASVAKKVRLETDGPCDDAEHFSPSIVPAGNLDPWEPYLGLAVRRVFPKGHTLIQQGTPVGGVFHLTTGRVRYSMLSRDGRVKTVALLEPGNLVGDGPTILERPCAFSVTALTDCEAHFFSAEVLDRLIDSDPVIARSVLYSLARKLRALAAQVADLAFLDSRTRVARLIDTLCDQHGVVAADGSISLGLELTHSEIAQITGNNRVTITGILSELESLGCIHSGKKSIVIRDKARLADIAAAGQLY